MWSSPSSKELRMSLPMTAVGPLKVLTKPIFTDLPWAMAGPAANARTAPAAIDILFIRGPPFFPSWRRYSRSHSLSIRRTAARCATPRSCLVHLDVLEVAGLVVDTGFGRGDPGGELAALPTGRHQAGDEIAVRLGGEPLVLLLGPLRLAQHLAVG